MNDVEGQDEPTVASHLQGGILVNVRSAKVASVVNLKRRIYERNGMVHVADGTVGCAKHPCDCTVPCGFRYFPMVGRLRDLQMSDIEALLKRVYDDKEIGVFARWMELRRQLNNEMRATGALRRNDEMFLGRVPGVLVRGLCHDFPDEFSTLAGGTVQVQHMNLEKTLQEFFVNRCFTSRRQPA